MIGRTEKTQQDAVKSSSLGLERSELKSECQMCEFEASDEDSAPHEFERVFDTSKRYLNGHESSVNIFRSFAVF